MVAVHTLAVKPPCAVLPSGVRDHLRRHTSGKDAMRLLAKLSWWAVNRGGEQGGVSREGGKGVNKEGCTRRDEQGGVNKEGHKGRVTRGGANGLGVPRVHVGIPLVHFRA